MVSSPLVAAPVAAYDAALQPGNQSWTGTLGLAFQVNAPITVLSLGVFDSNGDGIAGTILAGIFDTGTTLQVTPTLAFTGAADTLINGNRFRDLGVPVVLPAGTYMIAAQGFGASDLNGNTRCTTFVGGGCVNANPFLPPALNNGGGLITFLGPNRYSLEGSGFVLPGLDLGDPAVNGLLAGTFRFEVVGQQVPEPSTGLLLVSGLLVAGLLRRGAGRIAAVQESGKTS